MFGNDQNTILLLHFDGSNGSTSFPDVAAGATAHTATANGSAQLSTAQTVFGTASLRCDGTANSYVNLDGASNLANGTGDFTIDFRIRFNTLPGAGGFTVIYDGRGSGVNTTQSVIYTANPAGTTTIRYLTNGADLIAGTTGITTGQWYHIAVARSGTTTKLFLDGAVEGSAADSTNYNVGTNRPTLMGNGSIAGATLADGWMDELRYSKTARWTAAFTPPNEPYDVPAWFNREYFPPAELMARPLAVSY